MLYRFSVENFRSFKDRNELSFIPSSPDAAHVADGDTDTDVAWFLKSPNRFNTKPSWFSWKNTEEVLFTRDDPKPFFYQFFNKVFSYRTIMNNKRH